MYEYQRLIDRKNNRHTAFQLKSLLTKTMLNEDILKIFPPLKIKKEENILSVVKRWGREIIFMYKKNKD